VAEDLVTIRHTLSALADLQGHPVSESALATEIEIRANRPLTLQQVQSALTFCKDKGLAEWRMDDFRQRLWAITPAGAAKASGL
jgi:hypothetical protein